MSDSPGMFNLNLIMRKQTNPDGRTYCRTTGLDFKNNVCVLIEKKVRVGGGILDLRKLNRHCNSCEQSLAGSWIIQNKRCKGFSFGSWINLNMNSIAGITHYD